MENKKGIPNKKLDLFMKQDLNNSFVSDQSRITES